MATVLVVDDEFGIGEVLEAILSDAGHRVILAVNGKQALDKLAGTAVDLVISDLMMPVLDGAGLLAAIRRDPANDAVRFILMCALPESSIAERISGYDAFLRKPFRIAKVLETVQRVLDSAGPAAR